MMYYLEAEYASGYVHSSQHQDVSPYMPCEKVDGVPTGHNIFSDILAKRPEPFHGKMVRYSLVTPSETYTVDWTALPDNARPIHLVDKQGDWDASGERLVDIRITGLRFGYQCNDAEGKNHKEIKEII